MHSSLGVSIAYSHSEKGVGKPHEFTSSQNAVCSNMFFPLVGRLCSRGFYFTFWLSKWDFSRLFYTERSWRAYWFSVVLFLFVADRICLLMQEHFLWPLLKRKLNESLSFFKYCDQIVKNKYMFIFFQACERAESSKSCNLIASMKSGRYFTILPAEGPIVYYVAGWGGGGRVQFSKTLNFGGSILKMHKMWVGSKF